MLRVNQSIMPIQFVPNLPAKSNPSPKEGLRWKLGIRDGIEIESGLGDCRRPEAEPTKQLSPKVWSRGMSN